MTYYREPNIIVSIALVVALAVAGIALFGRAVDIEYGEERCDRVTVTATGWEPVGWNPADGYEPLYCPIRGQRYLLEEDGSLSRV